MGSNPLALDVQPTPLNGAIYMYVNDSILKCVVASAVGEDLGALFLNCKEGKVIQLVLHKLGHPQPPIPIHCDKQTEVGIANKSVKN